METAEIIYEGELITIAKHNFSGETIKTDAPLDNNGKASSFSPTDLMSVSLVSCMMTIVGINAAKTNLEVGRIKAGMTKFMGINPRRITEIKIDFTFEKNFTDDEKEKIQEWALNCPVAKSIHPELKQTVSFSYGAKWE